MDDTRDIHWLKIAEAAQYLGVSDETLRRWEAKGILIPQRTPGNQRRYTEVQLEAFERRRTGIEVAEDVLPQPSSSNLQGDTLHGQRVIPADRPPLVKAKVRGWHAPILLTLGGAVLLGSLVFGWYPSSQLRNLATSQRTSSQVAGVTTEGTSGVGSVLAAIAEANQDVFFSVTVPAFFNNLATFKDAVTFEQNITAPNIVYSVTGGEGITVTGGQNPTVSITDPNVDAYTKVKVGDTTMTAGEEDTLTFAAGGTVSVAIDTTNKKVTFTGATPDLTAAGGWTDSGTVVSLTTDGDVVSIGGSGSTTTYNAIADSVAGASVNVDSDNDLYIEGNLEVDGTIYGNISGSIGTALTEGSVTFIDSTGSLAEDNANFFWDDATNRLGVGTNNPQYGLDVAGTFHAGGATTLSSTLDVSGDTNLLATLDVTGAGIFLSTLEVSGNIDFNGTGTNDIAGTLNLSGNTLTATGDLVINPAGGGTKIGTGTPASADMAGSDLYVTGDFEVGGTIYGGLSGTVTTSFSQGSIVFITGGGALAEDNTNFFWDDSTNRLGIGDNTPSYALDVNGTANVNGAATFNSTITFGDATADTVTFNGYIGSSLIPTTASTYDLGDAIRTWDTLYVDNIVAANISTTATDLNGTSAQSFTINNDNATADTESSSLVFDRGTPSVNASLGWDAVSKWLEVNSSTFSVNADGETGITYSGKAALLVNQVQNQDLIAASASGSTRFVVDVNGAITASGIGKVVIVDGNKYARTCAGINAAIDALPSTGGEVFLPEGTYVCNETVTIDVNNTMIRGVGVGTVITAASAANGGTGQSFGHVINLNGKDNLTLEDFKILGNAGGGSTNDLISDGSSAVTNSLFQNLTLTSADDAGWSIQAGGVVSTLNTFNGNTITSCDGTAIYPGWSTYTTFSNNIIKSNGNGIDLTSTSNLKIFGNHFESNTSGALNGEAANNTFINDNMFTNHITGSPLTIRFFRGWDIVVSGNIFNNNYISIQADRRDTGGYIISNNNFVGSASTLYAILLNTSGSAPGTVVSGNYISGYSAVSAIGIYINGVNQSDAKIVNNSFRSNTTDITDLGATTNVINSNNGNTVIGGADNSPDATLELYRASSSDPRFIMSDGDVAHGVTTLADTDVFLNVGTISSTIGGARITGFADADGQALEFKGVQSSNPTDITPAIKMVAAKASGTGVVDLAAGETVFQIANNDDAAGFTMLGDGKIGIGTVTPDALLMLKTTSAGIQYLAKLESGAGGVGDGPGIKLYSTGMPAGQFASIEAPIIGASDQALDFLVNGGNNMRLTTGKAGIGTTTMTSNFNLDVTSGQAMSLFYHDSANYQLNLTYGEAASDIKWIWNMTNNGTAYADMLVFHGGRMGIGANTPTAKLEIANADADNDEVLTLDTEESTVSQAVFTLESDTTGNSQSADTVKAHFEADGSLFVSLTGSATTNGLCHTGSALDNNDEIVDCSGAPSDYAEWYPAKTEVAVGDIVSVSDEMFTYDAEGSDPFTGHITQMGSKTIGVLTKATSAARAVGIVSTGPYSVIGEDVKKSVERSGNTGLKPVPLALNGRVPVNIASDSQTIVPGDELMLSDTAPGKAMKATGAGNIVGKALSAWSPNTEESTVMAFVQNTWSSGDAFLVRGESFSLSQLAQMVVSHEAQIATVAGIASESAVLDEGRNESIFEKLVTFFSNVIFRGVVSFEKPPVFASDTAGRAIITKYTDRVDVVFTEAYEAPPIVTISLATNEATDSAWLAETAGVHVSNVTTRGFSIALPSIAMRDYTFNWMALAVKDARETRSSSTVNDALEAMLAADASGSGDVAGASASGELAPTPSPDASPSQATDAAGLQ